MKYERVKITDPLTGIELRELLDYVDTLEAALKKIAHLDDVYATPARAGSLALKLAREALDKGK